MRGGPYGGSPRPVELRTMDLHTRSRLDRRGAEGIYILREVARAGSWQNEAWQ